MMYKFFNLLIINLFLISFIIVAGCGKRADLERPAKIEGLEPANIE